MDKLHLDFETYSQAPLTGTNSVGAWAYSIHPSTEVLIMAWAFNDDEPAIWLPGMDLPAWVHRMKIYRAFGPQSTLDFQLVAWNDFFELSIMKNVLGWLIPEPKYWCDAAADAAALALPRGLADCGEALGLNMEDAKDKEGKKLINLFCSPKKSAKKVNKGELIRTYPADEPEKFEQFIKYCIQDVIAERNIGKMTRPLAPASRALWELDRKINLRGVNFDMKAVKDAVVIREKAKKAVLAEVEALVWRETQEWSLVYANISKKMPRLENIGSRPQFLAYIQAMHGIELENAQKEYLKDIAENRQGVIPEDAIKLIRLRLKLAKSSLAKYDKLLKITDKGIAYGLLRFFGASTGRWSGNLFQPQNLPRPSFDDTDQCISLFHHQDPEVLDLLYGDALEALSSCLRGMIIPSPGCRLVVSDFSQIESRVLAWLAGDNKKLDVYRTGLDIYKVNAAAAFKKIYDAVTKDDRVIGKVIELACGYQGAVGAFQQFAKVYGVVIPDHEAKILVANWRTSNPKITSYWYNVEATAVKAVANPGTQQTIRNVSYKVVGSGRRRFLFCKLPSGRVIAYHRPSLVEGKFGKQQIRFWGVDSVTKTYREQHTYGGKLVENITQACAFDMMADRMPVIEEAGYKIKLTVHDEIVSEAPIGQGSIEEFNQIMEIVPAWAQGLPVDAAGYEAMRYRK